MKHNKRHHSPDDSVHWGNYHIYEVGEFFFPCNWDNPEYCAEVKAMVVKPANISGMHQFSASRVQAYVRLRDPICQSLL